MHDALCVVKRVLESKTVVPGGGAVEAALSIYLENFASSLVSNTAVRVEIVRHRFQMCVCSCLHVLQICLCQ